MDNVSAWHIEIISLVSSIKTWADLESLKRINSLLVDDDDDDEPNEKKATDSKEIRGTILLLLLLLLLH